jgi:hypothetical protein
MIDKLGRGLTVEVVFIAAFIGLAFRSFAVMVASVMPAIFPVVAAGTLLWLLGDGLRFASVVALTVSLGLGLSATIHFLNRMRLEDRPQGVPGVAVQRATILMGPPLILTTVVLACGFVVTVLSALPMLQIFGWLSALAMLLALIADRTILRPTITLLRIILAPGATARRSERAFVLNPISSPDFRSSSLPSQFQARAFYHAERVFFHWLGSAFRAATVEACAPFDPGGRSPPPLVVLATRRCRDMLIAVRKPYAPRAACRRPMYASTNAARNSTKRRQVGIVTPRPSRS